MNQKTQSNIKLYSYLLKNKDIPFESKRYLDLLTQQNKEVNAVNTNWTQKVPPTN